MGFTANTEFDEKLSDTSKFLTILPIIFGLIFVGIDFALGDQFTLEQTHIQLIEFAIGSTVIGGTANAGFKRFVKYKEKGISNG